ncbi:MAG: transcription elongation factor GreB [Burkholderiales bacterium]|nr:transcription elongation factor GreB [Burkholderiales bacterium]
MSKAFTKETTDEAAEDDGGLPGLPPLPAGTRNYITPGGYAALKAEFDELYRVERPKLVETIAWAASNGDRSENGDYIYGKRRLRQIDSRIRFLSRRMEAAEVVDPARQAGNERIFFGATVTYSNRAGEEHTVTIVGVDEAEPSAGRISWISPVARALMKAREGDSVTLATPAGREELDVLAVRYL